MTGSKFGMWPNVQVCATCSETPYTATHPSRPCGHRFCGHQGQGGESGLAIATRSRWSPTGFAEADPSLSWCGGCRVHCRLDHIMLLLSCASAGHWLDVCISPSWESWLQTLCHILDPYCEDRTGFVHNFFFIILKATNVKSFCLLLWEKKKALKLLGFFKKTQEMSFRSKITFYKIKTMS